MSNDPAWIEWVKHLTAIAQNGLTYAKDPYDIERYTQLRRIAAEMLARTGAMELEVVLGVLGDQTGYATPKVDMRGVVFRDDRLLLVRERSDGRWSLPGGWADPGESPAENVVREIREESGFVARARKILAIYDRSKHSQKPPFAFHVYKLFMLCELTGGTEQTSNETDAIGFFAEHEIPELSGGRVTAGQIQRMFEHHRNPELPADFDAA
jgi:ADP-ribose pyrophosphatase YjhB (NUDIX family)